MSEEQKNDAGLGEDALPMQKASPTAFIVGGAALLVVGGLAIYAMSSGDSAEVSAENVEKSEKAADKSAGLTKEEIEERKQHLAMTQAALVAAAADDADESKKKQATQEQQKQAAAPSGSPSPAPKSSGPAPKPVNTKKSSADLDALGADITSALK